MSTIKSGSYSTPGRGIYSEAMNGGKIKFGNEWEHLKIGLIDTAYSL